MATAFRLREVMETRSAIPSIRQVAIAASLTYETVHNIYHNKTTRVDLATLDALAGALGCEPGLLIARAVPRGRNAAVMAPRRRRPGAIARTVGLR